MNRLILPIALLPFAVWAQDKTADLSGSQAGLKAIDAMKKLKGVHVEMDVESPQYKGKYTGLVKADGAAVGGTTDLWARKGQLMAKDGNGKIVPLAQLSAGSEELKAARAFRNPADMLIEIETACNQARQEALEVEKLEGIDCRKVRIDLRPEQKEALIKSLFGGTSGGVAGMPMPNPESMLNIPETTVQYVAWIGIEDLRIRKLTFEIKPVPKKGIPQGFGAPGMGPQVDPSQWTYRATLKLTKFDEGLDWKIPREVAQKLGIK